MKQVADIMVAAYAPGSGARRQARAAEKRGEYHGLSDDMLMKKIGQLEEQMYRHARDLEFERAAALRDEITALKSNLLDMPRVAGERI